VLLYARTCVRRTIVRYGTARQVRILNTISRGAGWSCFSEFARAFTSPMILFLYNMIFGKNGSFFYWHGVGGLKRAYSEGHTTLCLSFFELHFEGGMHRRLAE